MTIRQEKVTSLRVPHHRRSVGLARATLLAELNRLGTAPDRRDNAALVLSELVGNAIRHAKPLEDGKVLVSWILEAGILRISVSDAGSPTTPRVVDPSPLSIGGRGLAIVERLAQPWWSEVRDQLSTVYATLLV